MGLFGSCRSGASVHLDLSCGPDPGNCAYDIVEIPAKNKRNKIFFMRINVLKFCDSLFGQVHS